MKQETKIQIISIPFNNRYKVAMYLKNVLGYSLRDANEMIKDLSIIDFYGDLNKTLMFYNHIVSLDGIEIRLIIDCSHKTSCDTNCFILK